MTYKKFIVEADTLLPKALPTFYARKLNGTNLSSAIWFEADWTPHQVRLTKVGGTLGQAFKVISEVFSDSGQPVAANGA
jgi:hypothetical protein